MKRRDFLVIGGLLLFSLVLFLVFHVGRQPGKEVIVRVDGREQGRYSLSKEGRFELNGGTNILCIRDGKAYMESADCPDKVCIHQGTISKAGETIICLPNRLTVTVTGDGEVEGITG